MRYYPVFLDIKDRACLVVGGGRVAERKIQTLLLCQAKVRLVARKVTRWIKERIDNHEIKFMGENFIPSHAKNVSLVIAATNDAELNRGISTEARKNNVWCNVVDQPKDCTFILPALVTEGDLTVAISTSGKSPALAKMIRQELKKTVGPEYAQMLTILGLIRKKLLKESTDQEENQKIFSSIVHSKMLEHLKGQDWKSVDNLLVSTLGEEYSLRKLGVDEKEK